MSFIVLDLETSGLESQWHLPLQTALIHCDDNLKPLSELSLRCRLPAYIVPSPGALLTTGIGPVQLEQAPMSSTEMLSTIAKALVAWAPATVIGYNSIRFDEEMLRHAFFTHLLPPYATQIGGHRRADLLTMVRAVAMLEPSAITVPIAATGKPSFKLGDICRSNGIKLGEDEAHNALADARATLALFMHLRQVAPTTIAMMLNLADKANPNRMLAGGEVLLLGGASKLAPVVGVTANPTVATSWATVDLTIDPEGYINGGPDEIARLLTGPGPRPIRLVRTNAQPILLTYEQGCHALPQDQRDQALYHERADRVRAHTGFRANLAHAMANRFADREASPYPEASLYSGGFLSNDDARTSARWHASPWEDRPAIAAQFQDERLKAFANRLMLLEAPEAMSPVAWQKGQAWLRDRLTSEAEVPWLTLQGALRQVGELRAGLAEDEVGRCALLDEIERWLRQRSQCFQLAA
ncbi:exodeoxyribonuclease-1 [Bosea sp. BE271]|uniref:exonuclease domain-containing protein n=1 Tax=Bosea TaxID=85413 RepID=UPI002861DE77|nr:MULTISPECIES: exonuclease domain-containing protein [Bosea]MDR6826337.1 exodeoxyribonuclease-1 [Bosea robiniae]MDR6893047.1 exodeoxyribonuclease-1 [Bosea sp. BE109]MDR7137255.1 exodeoxyribonuclease-1 [Bosea sp. BE168]MDR7173955.1 exodeoxyribonuclease-1 [Bosea sp. BE271]